jgi:hypothetical protein
MNYWRVPRLWEGQTAFILGGGPSLRSVDLGRVQGRVIAINDAYRLYPAADILYFCDAAWWEGRNGRRGHVKRVFTGERIVTLENDFDGVLRLRNTGATGLETEPDGLRHGSNSGYQCINLAYHLGVKRIVLLGYDMRCVDGETHWGPRPEPQSAHGFERTLQYAMLPKFESLVDPLREAGVEVLNATAGSRLTCWPIVDIQAL